MTIFFSLLPIYIFGNLHCAGMCGPLVMFLARNPHKWSYFLGRLLSYTVAGLISAEMGIAFFSFLSRYHISATFSLICGLWIIFIGMCLMFKKRPPVSGWFAKRGATFSVLLGKLMTQKKSFSVFLFGFSTLFLPCGQIVIVYSIIALKCTPFLGIFHGFLFALLTSPSLVAAMHASTALKRVQEKYHLLMGGTTVLIGTLAILRGCADLNVIQHVILNPFSHSAYHIVLF